MVYDDATKKWLSPDGCVEPSRSRVKILHNVNTNAFRIVGTRLQDKQWILNCNIYEKLRYKSATPTFHQWRDEKRKVYGLSFLQEEEARIFVKVMSQALALLTSSNDYQNGSELGYANGIYHEPHQLHHNAHSAPSFRENDDESVYSGGLPAQCINNLRKSSHSVQSSSGIGSVQMMNSNVRRASQGSSSSSNASSLPPSIYATASSSNNCSSGSPSRPTGTATIANNQSTPSPTISSNNIAMACPTNVPPAPPPPPPPPIAGFNINKSNGNSIADQLKKVQLRKTSTSSAGNSVGASRGRDDLFSELEATLNKRKNLCENGEKDTSSNGTVRRPWEKQVNGNTPITESPKLQRKLPSSSYIAQEESVRSMGTLSNINVNPANSNGTSMDALDRWKDELLAEIKKEIEKAKLEIIEALRTEIKR